MDYQELTTQFPELFSNRNAIIKIITDSESISEWKVSKMQELQEKGLPLSWADIGVVLDDPYVIMIRDLVEFPSGYKSGYIRSVSRTGLQGGKGVVVLPEIGGKIVVLNQYRHSTRSWHLEIPRGFGESGISPEENAQKEIREEIQGEISELINLGVMHNNTGIDIQSVQLFYARLKSIGKFNLDEGIKSYREIDVGILESMIRDGEITDGFTISAYTRAKLKQII